MDTKHIIYYSADTGEVCEREPNNIPHDENTPWVEVSEEEYYATYVSTDGYAWAVKDDKLAQIADDKSRIKATISRDMQRLAETDYVTIKLYEAKITKTDEEYQALYETYKDTLTERQNIRDEINSLQEEAEKLGIDLS